jgi:serine protease Do
MGLQQTVTAGIISATGRANVGIADYEDFLQTDAAINPGNSGGPLVNIHGEVVGINTAIASRTGGNMGIGFAIPSNMAKSVQHAILKEGGVKRGRLGVLIQDLTPDLAASFGLDTSQGVLIGDVVPDGPAEQAGLQPGDIITTYDGKQVRKAYELRNAVAATSPDTKVTLEIVRDGEEREVSVTVGELNQASTSLSSDDSSARKLGLTVRPLTEDLREQLQLEARVNGVVVTKVQQGSIGQQGGIEIGDVIVSVDGQPITSQNDYSTAIANRSNSQGIRLQVVRDGVRRFAFLRAQ